MKKSTYFLYQVLLFPLGWYIAIYFGEIVQVLVLIGVIKIKDPENIRAAMRMRAKLGGGMFSLSNHPSGWIEVFLIPLLIFYPDFKFSPFKDFPWCTPKSEYMKTIIIWLWKPLFIRRDKNKRPIGVRRYAEEKAYLLHVMNQSIHEQPEGGRTKSEKGEIEVKNGKELRKLKRGYYEVLTNPKFCAQADASKVTVLVSWLTVNPGWTWPKLEVAFAAPATGDTMPPEVVTETLYNL